MRPSRAPGVLVLASVLAWACSEVGGGGAGGGSDSSAGGATGSGGTSVASGGVSGGAGNAGSAANAGSAGAGQGGGLAQGGSGGGGGASAGGSGGAASAGSGGTSAGGTGGTPPGLDSCPAPPAGASQATVDALNAVNTLRVAMGLECMELITELNVAAQHHCDYYQTNIDDDQCTGNAHGEVPSCAGYTGANPGARMDAAGYEGNGWSEVMAFDGDPELAVARWVNSVWHRTPLLSPWWRHMGYGGAEECDTIDLGGGPDTPGDVTALYPYPGQTGVPLEFHGDREGPTPPEPSTGWPSASPIHIYVRDAEVVSHRIDVQDTDAPLDHVFIDYEHEDNGDSQYIFYANEPFEAGTTYRVRASFTRGGQPLDFDWTFTTEN